jgi:hypothetical protein
MSTLNLDPFYAETLGPKKLENEIVTVCNVCILREEERKGE